MIWSLLERLLLASLTLSLLFALATFVMRRWGKGLTPGLRAWIWWAVAAKALALLLAPGVIPLEVPTPTLVKRGIEAPAPQVASFAPAIERAGEAWELGDAPLSFGRESTLETSVDSSRWTHWMVEWFPALIALAWLVGALFQLSSLGAQAWSVARSMSAARTVTDERVCRIFDSERAGLGLGAVGLMSSAAARSFEVRGLRRPTVLIPVDAVVLSEPALRLALRHELLHVRRRDLLLGWIPALASCLFFFHPLVRRACAEYALEREAACDSAALGGAPCLAADYGELLLRMATRRGPETPVLALPIARETTLKRRIRMLAEPQRTAHPSMIVVALLLFVVVLAPVGLVAEKGQRTAPSAPERPSVVSSPSPAPAPELAPVPSATQTPPSPVSAPRPAATPSPSVVVGVAAAPVLAPTPPTAAVGIASVVAPRTAVAAVVLPSPSTAPAVAVAAEEGQRKKSYSWVWSDGDGESYVVLLDGQSFVRGESADLDRARGIRRGDEDLLWFRRDGGAFVVRDPNIVARAAELFEPQSDLGRRQGELGSRQGELGGQQGELGARQGELARAQAELARNSRRARPDEQEMRRLAREQAELGKRQAELGQKQSELGKLQAELGRQQTEASHRAQAEMEQLIDEAMRTGLAQPVR